MPAPQPLTHDPDFTRILGIRFFTGPLEPLLALASRGGLFVFPSGPGLAELDRAPHYRQALERSDVAVTDSGAMVLLWRLRTGQHIDRISGLRFLRALLALPELRQPHRVFWVMPSEREAQENLAWLNAHGLPTTPDDTYIAPRYDAGPISDPDLVATSRARAPTDTSYSASAAAFRNGSASRSATPSTTGRRSSAPAPRSPSSPDSRPRSRSGPTA